MPHDPSQVNGWSTWSKHVIEELKRLSSNIDKLDNDMHDQKLEMIQSIERIRSEIKLLKFQASLWGSVAGTVFGAIVTLIVKNI